MRVLIFDLLAERSEFGHQGNIQMIKHLANNFSKIDVLLVTPQYQDIESLTTKNLETIISDRESQPFWNENINFKSFFTETKEDTIINFHRINMPVGEISELSEWIKINNISCAFCSGSRRNVSEPEFWMDSAKKLILGIIKAEIPFLGICFGHQLLSDALGYKVARSDKRTDSICKIKLTELGVKDPIFNELSDECWGPTTLFTHQDYVLNLNQSHKLKLSLLGETEHCEFAAVRVSDDNALLPVWGVQFHPEATKSMIKRSYELGDITLEEKEIFDKEHDGDKILLNFSLQVIGKNNLV